MGLLFERNDCSSVVFLLLFLKRSDGCAIVVGRSVGVFSAASLWRGVFLFVRRDERLVEERQSADLQWGEVLGVEVVVVVVAELSSEHRQVLCAYYYATSLCGNLHHTAAGIKLSGVLQCLVVVAETADLHGVQCAVVFNGDVEVAHHVACKVVLCKFKEQSVLVNGVGGVGYYEQEVGVALC